MRYEHIVNGTFIKRINRFTAKVYVDGAEQICHVKNTGRLKELLYENAEVFLQQNFNPDRKTKYSLIGVKCGTQVINIDSQAPNAVVKEALSSGSLFSGITYFKPEQKFKNSRFDFYLETEGDRMFLEVKGVTLLDNQIAKFPDAPTSRGVKHIKELMECIKDGYQAGILFVIQRKGAKSFVPNREAQEEFADILKEASGCGVKIAAYDCITGRDFIALDQPVKIII